MLPHTQTFRGLLIKRPKSIYIHICMFIYTLWAHKPKVQSHGLGNEIFWPGEAQPAVLLITQTGPWAHKSHKFQLSAYSTSKCGKYKIYCAVDWELTLLLSLALFDGHTVRMINFPNFGYVCLLEITNSHLSVAANTHTHTQAHTRWEKNKEKGKDKITEQVSENSLIKQIKLMAAAWLLPTKKPSRSPGKNSSGRMIRQKRKSLPKV